MVKPYIQGAGMNILGLGGVIDAVGKVADDLFTSDEERGRQALEQRKIEADLQQGQINVNQEEAKHASIFVAGARPAILWVGATALAWTYIAHPMLMWAWAFLQSMGYVPAGMAPPPTLGSDTLWVIISGILGLGGYRTFEKTKGVAS
jgi:hypothetical protein